MKRTQKGFTLIELIVVLAIFSIILALVMSFIDPVAKIMKKASVRERTAAYVDNIGEYIDNSVHYAEFVRVYNGGYCKADNPASPMSEKDVVKELVLSSLNGAVNDTGNYVQGKARVLKLINIPHGTEVQGQIYESVYNFTAGEIFEIKDDAGNVVSTPVNQPADASEYKMNKPVINDEHLEEYSYYYNTGFYTFDSLDDPTKYVSTTDPTKSFASTKKTFYSTLYPIMYDGDSDGLLDDPLTMNTISNENLCVNVVAYLNDEPDNMEMVNHEKADGDTELIPVFKSPSHLTSTSMSLTNVIGTHDSTNPIYVKLRRKSDGTEDMDGTKHQFQNVMSPENLPYSVYTAADSINDGNVYIVFILPNEINDTELIYN